MRASEHMRVRRCLGLLLVATMLAGCLDDFEPPVQEIRDVRRVASSSKPPRRSFDGAPTTALPDIIRNAARQEDQSFWYEARVPLTARPSEPWAVYLPRFAQSAEIFVNDRWIGSSGRVTAPLSRNWNRPALFAIPPGTLRDGNNDVVVHLVLHTTAPAFLTPFYVGPDRQLGPAHRLRYFFQITIARYGAVVMAAIALILGFVALRRAEFPHFRFFTIGCLFWALATSELFVEAPPFSPRAWQILTAAAAALSIVFFIQMTHRSFARHRPRLEVAAFSAIAAAVTILALIPDRFFELGAIFLFGGCVIMASYLGYLFMLAERPKIPRGRALIGLGIVGLVIGIHDLLLGVFLPVWPSFFLVPALSIIAALWGAWVVIDYFLGALQESETLNRELEDRVATKHAELEANYQRLRELERLKVVSSERERLMREMHDGMGGQLVSALAMAEDGETSLPQIADVIRGALDDMRLVIDSLDPVIDDIPTLLGMIRGRIEPRLRVHGLRFDWRVTDLPPTPRFGPEQFLHVLRIAQEAITNIVKHADAQVIRVETEATDGADGRPGIQVSIGDDGRGLGTAHANGGRGLDNMRVRAERLHGTVEVTEGAVSGTTVRLWIPMDAASED